MGRILKRRHRCHYGCGQGAGYQFDNDHWCCEKYTSQCPVKKEKNSRVNIGRKRLSHTLETRIKISKANKGKKYSPEIRANMSKAHLGKKLSLEHCANISKSVVGRKFSLEHCAKISKAKLGKKHTLEARAKMSKANRGRKYSFEACVKNSKSKIKYYNNLFKDKERYDEWYKNRYGIYPEEQQLEYCPIWNKEFKDMIRERDGYICQRCRINQNGKAHDVHHIDGIKKNCELINCITLCASCHMHFTMSKKYMQAEPEEKTCLFWEEIMRYDK